MTTLEIARKLAQLNQEQDACKAYGIVLSQGGEPGERLEAASYLFAHHQDYRVAYTAYVQLYRDGYYREEIVPLLTRAFYAPNVRLLRNRYERNCAALGGYPYCFRKDFPSFEDLPISFFPFQGESGYLPFDMESREFAPFVDVKDPVVSRNFFHDLEKPILAQDVFSQYELEYLNDNVRQSELVGKENHIYLHYSSFPRFCAWLQVLDIRRLLEEKKLVFLFEEELEQYPIDFQARFGIDYSQYEPKPVSIREVHRLIWHTQLSTHNGGDFFNEIFDNHPNLIFVPSIMYTNVDEVMEDLRERLRKSGSLQEAMVNFQQWKDKQAVRDLYFTKKPTDKDLMVAWFMDMGFSQGMDRYSRIAPAVFFQPHLPNIAYEVTTDGQGRAVLDSADVTKLQNSSIFQAFPYIKTFTPMRRFTTSHGATVRFMYQSHRQNREHDPNSKKKTVVPDAVTQRVLNRSFMRNPEQRIYRDSIIVRFEDGKLNPEATFRPLAAFLDLPYTESMTYCSDRGVRDVQTMEGNVVGFDPASVYKTYDEFVNDSERCYIEFFLRDAYEYYGYSFHYYDGSPMDGEKIRELVAGFDTINHYMEESYHWFYESMDMSIRNPQTNEMVLDISEKAADALTEKFIQGSNEKRIQNGEFLLKGLFFVNRNGQPLQMTPMLQPDPELLVQPLYH